MPGYGQAKLSNIFHEITFIIMGPPVEVLCSDRRIHFYKVREKKSYEKGERKELRLEV